MFWPRNEMRNEIVLCPRFFPRFRTISEPQAQADPPAGLC